MDEGFDQTTFSFYFNGMLYLGIWGIETEDRTKKLLYSIYRHTLTMWSLFMSYMGVLDFYYSVPHINKMVYNVCFNIFIVGTMAKIRLTAHNFRKIDSLRRKLHRNVNTCRDAEELQICDNAVQDLNFIAKIFLSCLLLLYPIWLILNMLSGELWGERQYPLPSKWPTDLDINDSTVFFSTCVFHGVFAIYFLLQAAALDASIFGLLAQIYREYRFLIKKINEFGEFCEDMYREESAVPNAREKMFGEKNIFLKKIKMKHILREIITRQRSLFEFSEDFESSYNKTMFVHIFAGGTLLCVNGIQAMIVSFHFSIKMAYQLGYVLLILTDILYLCWMTNKISVKCFEVGNAFYGIPWYKLDIDIQKDISFVILRSQKAPRITSGNFIELNLPTAMVILKNIYSWLAMFRQVALK